MLGTKNNKMWLMAVMALMSNISAPSQGDEQMDVSISAEYGDGGSSEEFDVEINATEEEREGADSEESGPFVAGTIGGGYLGQAAGVTANGVEINRAESYYTTLGFGAGNIFSSIFGVEQVVAQFMVGFNYNSEVPTKSRQVFMRGPLEVSGTFSLDKMFDLAEKVKLMLGVGFGVTRVVMLPHSTNIQSVGYAGTGSLRFGLKWSVSSIMHLVIEGGPLFISGTDYRSGSAGSTALPTASGLHPEELQIVAGAVNARLERIYQRLFLEAGPGGAEKAAQEYSRIIYQIATALGQTPISARQINTTLARSGDPTKQGVSIASARPPQTVSAGQVNVSAARTALVLRYLLMKLSSQRAAILQAIQSAQEKMETGDTNSVFSELVTACMHFIDTAEAEPLDAAVTSVSGASGFSNVAAVLGRSMGVYLALRFILPFGGQ